MKKNVLYILLFLASCTSSNMKQDGFVMSDLDVDFPVTDTIHLNPIPLQSFEILAGISSILVKDTALFVFEHNPDNFGHCYSINSGKELSVIVGVGNAMNEFIKNATINTSFVGDSIQLRDFNNGVVMTFLASDVVTKPLGEREFSIRGRLKHSPLIDFTITDKNILVGINKDRSDDTNRGYCTYDGKDFSFFGEIKKEMFNSSKEVTPLDMKWLRFGSYANYGNKVVMSETFGIILHVIDVDKKSIDFERYYSQILCEESNGRIVNMNNYDIYSYEVSCNEKNIFSPVRKKNIKKSEEAGEEISDHFTLVFDWELNPIKKYYFAKPLDDSGKPMKGTSYMSEDAKTYYFLSTEGEKQELYIGVISD